MAKLSFELEVSRISNLNVFVSCASLNCVLMRQFFREIATFISRISSFNDFSCLFCRYGETLFRIGGLPNSKFERSGNPTQAIKGRCLVLQKSLRRSFAIGSCVTKVKSLFFPKKMPKRYIIVYFS